MAERIFVWNWLPEERDPVLCGVFEYEEKSYLGRFQYVKSYLENPQAVAIGPLDTLPLQSSVMTFRDLNEGIPGPLRDALPDYWGRLVFAKSQHVAVEQVSNLQLLSQSNPDRIGSLDFTREPKYAVPVDSSSLTLEDFFSAAEEIQKDSGRQDISWFLAPGSSMGGARPKCTIRHQNGLWIAKFPARNDRFPAPAVEWATMRMAGDAGINVPETELIRLKDGSPVFLIKRFDRNDSGGKMGFVSALTILHLDERENAKGSYMAIADTLRRCGAGDQLQELYRRMVFNVFARNTDDHLRNHGFLRSKNGWRLSPAYDITPTVARIGVGSEFDLSISIGKQGRSATVENLLSACEQFHLDHQQATGIIAEVREVTSRWRDYFVEAGISKEDQERFVGSFEGGPSHALLHVQEKGFRFSPERERWELRPGKYNFVPDSVPEQGPVLVRHAGRQKLLEVSDPALREQLRASIDSSVQLHVGKDGRMHLDQNSPEQRHSPGHGIREP